MRILYLSQVLPYPVDAGPKMRSYYVLRQLVQQHQVTLLTFIRDTDRPDDIAHLTQLCHTVHTVPMHRNPLKDARFFVESLVTRHPFLIVRDKVPAMVQKVRSLAASEAFDVVHADQLWMAPYALAARQAAPQTKLILDQHNAVYLIPERMSGGETNPIKQRILARESRLLTQYEPEVCHQFDHVVWVTAEDRQAVAKIDPQPAANGNASTVIPICADPAHTNALNLNLEQQRITFLGGLHWPPNAQGILWFAQEVFPKIKARLPQATLTVIGKKPPAGLAGEGIEVTGYVEDLQPYLATTAAFIVPLHAGGGMRVKILDAWSWGLPVVSTTIGAEGISVTHGQNALIADTAAAFAAEIEKVLTDPALARRLGQNGRQTVLQKYNWQTVYPAWEQVYQHVAAL